MWNSEARDSSPIIFTIMSSWKRPKTPPPHGRRDKTELVEESRCWTGLDELEPEPWVSLWNNHFGEESTPPLAWTEGNEMPPAPPGRKGQRGYPSDQIHCVGGARSGTRRGRGKIVASEDFASSSYMCICAKFLFPHWGFFSFFCTAWYMCTLSIVGRCRMGVCL